MGKKTTKKRVGTTRISFARVPEGKWKEALKRLREESERSTRITGEDLKVVINT